MRPSGLPAACGAKAAGAGHPMVIRAKETPRRPPDPRGAPCTRFPPELPRQASWTPIPPPCPPGSSLLPAAGRCRAGAERSARPPGPTCQRCAGVAAPGSTGRAAGPTALSRSCASHPPSWHFRIARPRPWAAAAKPWCAGSAPPSLTEPPWGPLTDPATAGPGSASGQAGPTASPGLRGDARERGGLDRRLGSFGNWNRKIVIRQPHPSLPQCSVGPWSFPAPSGSSGSVQTQAINQAT